MVSKIETKKSGLKINPQKIPCQISEKGLLILYSQNHYSQGTTTNLQIVLNTQKNPYPYQTTEKKYLPNFTTQKNPLLPF